jgi:hypothetical protein
MEAKEYRTVDKSTWGPGAWAEQFAATMDPKFRTSLDLLVNRARIHDQIRTSLVATLEAIESTQAAIPLTLCPAPSVTAVIPIELVNNARAWLQAHRELVSPPSVSDEHDA